MSFKTTSKLLFSKTNSLNEACFNKVNWLAGYEECVNKQLFDCLWLNTNKINKIMQKELKSSNKRTIQKARRDEKIVELLPEDAEAEERFYKFKAVNITNMIGSVLKNTGVRGNPLQSMTARNIRHFENVRKKILDKYKLKVKTNLTTDQMRGVIFLQNNFKIYRWVKT